MANLQGFFWYDNPDNYYLGHQFSEMFKDRIYQPYMKKDMVVMDVGANIGLFTLYAAPYASKIYAIEPSLEHVSLIEKMVEFNKLDHVEVHKLAIYKENGMFELGHNENKTMYSLHQLVKDPKLASEMTEAVTFEKFFTDNHIEHIDLLKLDVEGSEAEILGHTSFTNVASKIDMVVAEIHSWNGRHPNQIRESFKNNGFNLVESIPNDANLIVARKN